MDPCSWIQPCPVCWWIWKSPPPVTQVFEYILCVETTLQDPDTTDWQNLQIFYTWNVHNSQSLNVQFYPGQDGLCNSCCNETSNSSLLLPKAPRFWSGDQIPLMTKSLASTRCPGLLNRLVSFVKIIQKMGIIEFWLQSHTFGVKLFSLSRDRNHLCYIHRILHCWCLEWTWTKRVKWLDSQWILSDRTLADCPLNRRSSHMEVSHSDVATTEPSLNSWGAEDRPNGRGIN